MTTWERCPVVKKAMDPSQQHTLDSLSQALKQALGHLVVLAGGWKTRPTQRRLAYDSNEIRMIRQRLEALHRLERLCSGPLPGARCWPQQWIQMLDSLSRRGVDLPRSNVSDLRQALARAVQTNRQELATLLRHMRQERSARWRSALPTIWKERPAIIQHWLEPSSVPWGSRPVLDSAGNQCLTADEVDSAVRTYWVDTVMRQHATKDEDACWAAYLASPFGQHLPHATWPSSPWTGQRVRAALNSMREGASPGMFGVPFRPKHSPMLGPIP